MTHFYYLTKSSKNTQYIDATKRGGIGRFLNHSCAPNCYVAKWSVGIHVRMGIFASRKVQKNEELTFNYNVDRYGCVLHSIYVSQYLMTLPVMKRNPVIAANRNV